MGNVCDICKKIARKCYYRHIRAKAKENKQKYTGKRNPNFIRSGKTIKCRKRKKYMKRMVKLKTNTFVK